MKTERSYRGISRRLARHYLVNLGGEEVSKAVVEAETWTAELSQEKVNPVGSFTLNEVTIVFEGEELEELIERFSQKAMRAGG